MPEDLLNRASIILNGYETNAPKRRIKIWNKRFNFDDSKKDKVINKNYQELTNYLDTLNINNLRPIDALNTLDSILNIYKHNKKKYIKKIMNNYLFNK